MLLEQSLCCRVILVAALLTLSVGEEQYDDCLTNFSVLEKAVIDTKDNRYNIIKTFFSSNSNYQSVYVTVTYVIIQYYCTI